MHGVLQFTLFCCLSYSIWGCDGYTVEEEISQDASRLVLDLALPMDKHALQYLSSSLTAEECQFVYAILVVQYSSMKKSHKSLNLTETRKYAQHLWEQQQKLIEPIEKKVTCSASLDHWNRNLIGKLTRSLVDKQDVAETLLRVSLDVVGRMDLAKWLHSYVENLKKQDLEKLENEINSHHFIHNTSQISSIISLNADDVDDDTGHFLTFVIVLTTLGVAFLAALSVTIFCCSKPDPETERVVFQQKIIAVEKNVKTTHRGV